MPIEECDLIFKPPMAVKPGLLTMPPLFRAALRLSDNDDATGCGSLATAADLGSTVGYR